MKIHVARTRYIYKYQLQAHRLIDSTHHSLSHDLIGPLGHELARSGLSPQRDEASV
jgi:hypothetical protein